jgi:hypothetical protein
MKKNIVVFLVYIITTLILGTVFFLSKKYNIPFEKFTGDPALINKSNPFIGIISNVGALIWCTTASICLFSSSLLYFYNKKENSKFMLFSGVFTTILLLDDFFMIHDSAVYMIYPNDISQIILLLSYAIFAIWYIYNFYKIIIKEDYIILGTAFFFLGLSVGIDLFFESSKLEYFIEDSFKFIGIISWMLFFVTTCRKQLIKINS